MSEKAPRESAKIYKFPEGGRAGLGGERSARPIAADVSAPVAKIVWGSGWYHDDAVSEAEKQPGQRK